MPEALLVLDQVSKRFGGVVAVDRVSLVVNTGSITALIGPNGAGKTTLFALISGFARPSAGCVRFHDQDITGMAPYLLARRGIARTFQIVQPFAGLTVQENIAIGAHLRRRSRAAALDVAQEIAVLVGLADVLERPAASLTVAGRKRLELARALAIAPELLLLDEVLAGLNPAEVAAMLPLLHGLAGRGITILMIEHLMQAVMSLASEIIVLAEGRIVAAGAPQTVVADSRVIEAYLGAGAAQRLVAGRGADA